MADIAGLTYDQNIAVEMTLQLVPTSRENITAEIASVLSALYGSPPYTDDAVRSACASTLRDDSGFDIGSAYFAAGVIRLGTNALLGGDSGLSGVAVFPNAHALASMGGNGALNLLGFSLAGTTGLGGAGALNANATVV